MFHISLATRQTDYVRELVRSQNFGRRGRHDGDRFQQYLGLCGQVMIADLLGVPRPTGEDGGDGGVDGVLFGVTFDVKGTLMRRSPEPTYVGNFPEVQVSYATDLLIFQRVGFQPQWTEVCLCGLIPKREFLERAELVPEGSQRGPAAYRHPGPHRELAYSEMVSPESPEEIADVLRAFAALRDRGAVPTVELIRRAMEP